MSDAGHTAVCAICQARVSVDAIFGHLRGAHDLDVEPETWPDGELGPVDRTWSRWISRVER